jgi:hypothetical protein
LWAVWQITRLNYLARDFTDTRTDFGARLDLTTAHANGVALISARASPGARRRLRSDAGRRLPPTRLR